MRLLLVTSWWSLALRGIVALIVALITFAWPGITLGALVLLFGAYALIDGIMAFVGAWGAREADEKEPASDYWSLLRRPDKPPSRRCARWACHRRYRGGYAWRKAIGGWREAHSRWQFGLPKTLVGFPIRAQPFVVRYGILNDKRMDALRMRQCHAKAHRSAVILHVQGVARYGERFSEPGHDLIVTVERGVSMIFSLISRYRRRIGATYPTRRCMC